MRTTTDHIKNCNLQDDFRSANQVIGVTVQEAPFSASSAEGHPIVACTPNLDLASVPFIPSISSSKSYFTKFSFLLLGAGAMVLLMCSTAFETFLPIFQILSSFQNFRASKRLVEAPLGHGRSKEPFESKAATSIVGSPTMVPNMESESSHG